MSLETKRHHSVGFAVPCRGMRRRRAHRFSSTAGRNKLENKSISCTLKQRHTAAASQVAQSCAADVRAAPGGAGSIASMSPAQTPQGECAVNNWFYQNTVLLCWQATAATKQISVGLKTS